jgi:ketosteroid isomerase-like protein
LGEGNSALKTHLRRMLKAYGEGDLSLIREALEPDVVYHPHGPPELFRFAGRHVGLADAIAALSAIASDYSIHRYDVREMIGEGDIIWVTSGIDATDRRRHVHLAITLVARWQFRGVRVASVDEYFDSGEIALRQGLATASASGQ